MKTAILIQKTPEKPKYYASPTLTVTTQLVISHGDQNGFIFGNKICVELQNKNLFTMTVVDEMSDESPSSLMLYYR